MTAKVSLNTNMRAGEPTMTGTHRQNFHPSIAGKLLRPSNKMHPESESVPKVASESERIAADQKRLAKEIRELEVAKKVALWFAGFISILYLARALYESLK